MKEVSLKAFEQHGFISQGETGDQAYGICPFCKDGRNENHFYVNRETKQWDCKSCGRSGGFQTFLKEMVKYCQGIFSKDRALELSKERGLKVETLKEAGVGYNPRTKRYIIPVLAIDGSIWDIRIFSNKRLISTQSCKAGLFGWENMKGDTIWLCEGEWDAMVMREILKEKKINQTVLSTSAGTFKGEWVSLFRDKAVFVIYDNDEPGQQGAIKVFNALNAVADSLKFLNWGSKHPSGFDLRDFYKLEKDNTFKFLIPMFELYPPGASIPETTKLEFKGKGCKPSEVYKSFKKWLKFPKDDTTVLDILFGTIIANRLIGEPLWLFIVSPSGGMKSELLMTLFEANEVFSASSLSPHALISGCNFGSGGDPSLVPKLNGKVFIIKDFTVILSMNQNDREEIFGILRDCYDGSAQKQFGNGVFRAYKSKFGILAGVTPKIEQYTDTHVALGERFLRYKIPISMEIDDSLEIIERALENVTNEDIMREELNRISVQTLNYDFKVIPKIGTEIINKISRLAYWTSTLRAEVPRDKYTKEITHYASQEIGTRLAKQYKKLLMGIAMFRRINEVTMKEYNIVKRIAIDTIPVRSERIISSMYNLNKTTSYVDREISHMIGLPLIITRRLIENLAMLGVLEKHRLSSVKMKWSLSSWVLKVIEITEVYLEVRGETNAKAKRQNI